MDTFILIAILSAFAIGVAFGVLCMSLVAMASLGEDELPEIEPERIPRYQD